MTKTERREYHREWRKAHPDYYRKLQKERKDYYIEYNRTWRHNNPDYFAERFRDKPEEHKKYLVRMKLNNAVRAGKLEKLPCEKCQTPKVEGHHTDYRRPLHVIWLCNPHHKELHRKFI